MDAVNSKALYEKEKLTRGIKKELIQHFILGNPFGSPPFLGVLYYQFAFTQ